VGGLPRVAASVPFVHREAYLHFTETLMKSGPSAFIGVFLLRLRADDVQLRIAVRRG
jgi:hypothetical protein